MIKEKLKQLLPILKKDEGDNKKTIENLVVLIIILVATVIFINYIWNDEKKEKQNNLDGSLVNSKNIVDNNKLTNSEDSIEDRLRDILSKISGVGKVEVLITYSTTSRIIPVYNENIEQTTTEELDNQGGTRKISENNSKKDVVYQEIAGEKTVVTQSVINPQIEGAIIIAQGASNSSIKASIIQAVEAVTGIATYKIQVFEMN